MSGIDTKSLLAQALFRADPRSQECRDMIQQTMVEIALLNSDSPISEKQICDKISDMLEQPSGISKEECNKAIQKCLERDLIKKKHEGYVLKKEQKETLIKQRDGCIEDEKNFDDGLVQSVEYELGAALDDIAKTLLCSSVKTVIQRIFHEKSVELKRLISEGKCDYKSILKAGSKYDPQDALKNELRPMISLYALNKQAEVIGGVKSFLASMNEAATRYLINLHHRVFYFQLLNIDPGLIELQKKCFENTRLYLDTNVVIALLFEAYPLYAVVRDVLNACKVLSINLLVSPSTFGELIRIVSQSNSMNTITGEPKAARLITTPEGRRAEPIVATFLMKKQQEPNINWGGFIGPYEDMETYLLNSGIVLENEGYSDLKKHEYYNRVWQTIRSVRNPLVSDFVVDHDADNFILIHSLRQKYTDNPVLGPSVWLLTLDHSLKTDEDRLSSVFNVEHSKLIDEWGEILLPFQNIRQFVFSNYITYLVASSLGALIQIPASDFSILKIICNPELMLTDFFNLPIELQIKVLSGMQKDKNIRQLQERAKTATTSEDKTKIADEFRSKELAILAEEKKHIEEQASQLSKEINQLRDELGKVTSISGEKEKTVRDLTSKVKMAEERLRNYESMSFWDWFKKFFQRK